MSTLGERVDHLALMNHTVLLDTMIGALRDGPNPFHAVRKQGRDYLYVRIDEVAHAIAHAHAPTLPNPVQTTGKDPTCATVHGTPQQERDFAHRIRALDRALADCLDRAVGQMGTGTGTGADVPRYVAELCTPLSALDVRRVTGIGFAYELRARAEARAARASRRVGTTWRSMPASRTRTGRGSRRARTMCRSSS